MSDSIRSQREKEENKLFLETAHQAWNGNEDCNQSTLFIGLIMSYFKFGYGGCNGWFEPYDELSKSLDEWILNSANIESIKQNQKLKSDLDTAMKAIDKLVECAEFYKTTHPEDLRICDEVTLCHNPLTVSKGAKAIQTLESKEVREVLEIRGKSEKYN